MFRTQKTFNIYGTFDTLPAFYSMNSFIISSNDKTIREAYVMNFCQENHISDVDIFVLNKLLEEKKAKKTSFSIGIQDIKQFQQRLFLKPVKSKEKVCIIHDAHLLTTEAQNALLKVLEEPPLSTYIMLTTESSHKLLPTILSRCVIKNYATKQAIPQEEQTALQTVLNNIPNASIIEILELANELSTDKEKVSAWIEKAMCIVHKDILDSENVQSVITAKQLLHAYTSIKTTNVNVRMTLECCFLSISGYLNEEKAN